MTLHSRFPQDTPFADFRYCPRCGSASLSQQEQRALQCADCGFKFFFNCASAAGALLLYQGRLILGVRAKQPQKGMLDLPGGFIEYDETVEEALRREVKEEFNLDITHLAYLTSAPNNYCYADIVYKTTDLYFVCAVDDISSLKAGDDVADYEWVDPAGFDPEKLAFPSGRIAFQRLLELLQKKTAWRAD